MLTILAMFAASKLAIAVSLAACGAVGFLKITHPFVSTIPAGGNPGDVTTTAWNAAHTAQIQVVSYASTQAVPATGVDVIEASGTITLTLPSAVANNGLGYWIMNVGSGVITLQDAASANFVPPSGGASTYLLENFGQWVFVVSDGTQWLAFGN